MRSVVVLPPYGAVKIFITGSGSGWSAFFSSSVTFVATDTFLNDPSAGYNKNSFQFVTAASYTLK